MKNVVYICPKCINELLEYTCVDHHLVKVKCCACGWEYNFNEDHTIIFVPITNDMN